MSHVTELEKYRVNQRYAAPVAQFSSLLTEYKWINSDWKYFILDFSWILFFYYKMGLITDIH